MGPIEYVWKFLERWKRNNEVIMRDASGGVIRCVKKVCNVRWRIVYSNSSAHAFVRPDAGYP